MFSSTGCEAGDERPSVSTLGKSLHTRQIYTMTILDFLSEVFLQILLSVGCGGRRGCGSARLCYDATFQGNWKSGFGLGVFDESGAVPMFQRLSD